jgi:ketosteroid isomerase-like protein
MSEENVEIVRQVLDAFQEGLERGDLGAAFDTAMVAADAEWIPGRGFPGPRGYRGREGFIEFMRGWTEDFEGWSNQVERLIDAGNDRVVGVFRQSATGKEKRRAGRSASRHHLRTGRWTNRSHAHLP